MATVVFDPVAFRATYQAFRNVQCPTDAMLRAYFATACLYVSPDGAGGCCGGFDDDQRALACNLMTAHVAAMFDAATKGQPTGIVTQATIDKVSVTVKAPPVQNNSVFQHWLAQSPYGQMLLAMLNQAAAGGAYIGGSPERFGFRRVGGGFGPGWRW